MPQDKEREALAAAYEKIAPVWPGVVVRKKIGPRDLAAAVLWNDHVRRQSVAAEEDGGWE